MNNDEKKLPPVQATHESEWGKPEEDHFGYASDEERLAKRGMEDWELVENIGESQGGVPVWFVGVIITVLLVAIGLSFPFWGDRPDAPRDWVNWGFVAAIFYIGGAAALVYFMVGLYGSRVGGKLDSDKGKGDE
jgi:hypothetical protein